MKVFYHDFRHLQNTFFKSVRFYTRFLHLVRLLFILCIFLYTRLLLLFLFLFSCFYPVGSWSNSRSSLGLFLDTLWGGLGCVLVAWINCWRVWVLGASFGGMVGTGGALRRRGSRFLNYDIFTLLPFSYIIKMYGKRFERFNKQEIRQRHH